MKLLKPLDSLFVKTSLTLTLSVALFIFLAISFTWFFILSPLSYRAADDMAALISLTGKTWASLPAQQRAEFEESVFKQHSLFFSDKQIPTQNLNKLYPFIPRLEKALTRHTGQQVSIKQDVDNEHCFRFMLRYDQDILNIGFFHHRLGPRPPFAFTGIFITAALLILFTTLLLVRRITLPIKKLSSAVNQFGKGNFSTRISETGPTELASLAHSFNLMAKEIGQLMENRAIFFGGISHDLRTPITRMQIALELLEQDQDKALITRLKNNLIEMEFLIQQSLEFVKGIDKQHVSEIKLDEILNEIIADYRKRKLFIHCELMPYGTCTLDVQAFRRVLSNLLDNAFRYGDGGQVTLVCNKQNQLFSIQISDEGPGIPEEKIETVFQPFYRIDHSRNKKTGGSGLGLTIVKQLCEVHGWNIKLIPGKNGGVIANIEIPIR